MPGQLLSTIHTQHWLLMDLQYTLGIHELIHSNITGTIHSNPLNKINSHEHYHLGLQKVAIDV